MNLNLNLNLNLYVHHFAASVLPHVLLISFLSRVLMGLAHGLLDSPWKKLVYGKTLFSDTVTPALSTDTRAADRSVVAAAGKPKRVSTCMFLFSCIAPVVRYAILPHE